MQRSISTNTETLISEMVVAIEQMRDQQYDISLPKTANEPFAGLRNALMTLAASLQFRERERMRLNDIAVNINAGLLLEEILETVYVHFKEVIPYHRIGFSLIDSERETVRAHWARSEYPIFLDRNFTAMLKGSSLHQILTTGKPRIIDDLPAYLRAKPASLSTRLIVKEGMRSSLTCPLVNNGEPVGFIFFSSAEPYTYTNIHIDIFQQIAAQLSVILEKGRLVSRLAAQKEQIARTNAELVRVNELKSTFLGIATHDLRGPIGNIRMIVDLLQDSEISLSDEERRTLLSDIGAQSTHMLSLLNDLLDVTRIEAGKLELRFETFPLKPFLTQIVQHHAMMATPKGTRMMLQPVGEGYAKGDPVRLRQVIDNIISNAIKYSPPGSTVLVGVEAVQHGWRIFVQDEGPGITEDDRPKLFKDFAKLSAKPTGGERSVGLGLAIAHRIVKAHGGTIGVDSEVGRGAKFWFTLPDENALTGGMR